MVNGQLVVKEDEAQIIRRIFDLYLQGIGKQNIANILNAEGVLRRYGQQKWHHTTIDYVIKNGRYMGDALLQKKFTTDTLPFRKKKNHGENRNIMWRTVTLSSSAKKPIWQRRSCKNRWMTS